MLHARFVLAGELPAKVALLEVNSLLPVVWCNKGREHDDLGPDDFLGNGVIRIHDSEAQVPSVGVMWNFGRGPVRVKREFSVLKERVRVLDLLEERLFRPCGVFSHSISIDLSFGDHSARDLSVDNFVPNSGFGEGDSWMSWCQSVHDCFGCFRNVCVFGFVAESDSKIVLFCPSSQNCFDVVILGTGHIDFVGDNMGRCLDSFPGSVSAETKCVDLPILEGRPFGSGVDWGGGFGSLVCGLVVSQDVWIVRSERSQVRTVSV